MARILLILLITFPAIWYIKHSVIGVENANWMPLMTQFSHFEQYLSKWAIELLICSFMSKVENYIRNVKDRYKGTFQPNISKKCNRALFLPYGWAPNLANQQDHPPTSMLNVGLFKMNGKTYETAPHLHYLRLVLRVNDSLSRTLLFN